MMGPTVNLISETHHSCERREHVYSTLRVHNKSPWNRVKTISLELRATASVFLKSSVYFTTRTYFLYFTPSLLQKKLTSFYLFYHLFYLTNHFLSFSYYYFHLMILSFLIRSALSLRYRCCFFVDFSSSSLLLLLSITWKCRREKKKSKEKDKNPFPSLIFWTQNLSPTQLSVKNGARTTGHTNKWVLNSLLLLHFIFFFFCVRLLLLCNMGFWWFFMDLNMGNLMS